MSRPNLEQVLDAVGTCAAFADTLGIPGLSHGLRDVAAELSAGVSRRRLGTIQEEMRFLARAGNGSFSDQYTDDPLRNEDFDGAIATLRRFAQASTRPLWRRFSLDAPPPLDLPVDFRAEARVDHRGLLRRSGRVLHFDARWADGTVRRDVDLVELMYRRAPADDAVMRTALATSCPDEGPGPWLRYPDAAPVAD